MNPSNYFTLSIGRSVEGREQLVHANFDPGAANRPANATFIIGGMHGDEKATIVVLETFVKKHLASGQIAAPTIVLPLANPDGYERHTRYNTRGVDINRNCEFNWHAASIEPPGPAPWSEPETCALRDFILDFQPAKIVSLHWALAEIDADGPQSTALAHAMWDALDDADKVPYRLRVYKQGEGKRRLDHAYEICPGSLGQWCGYGLRYSNGASPAMITLELPYDPSAPRPEILPEDHLDSLYELWEKSAPCYMAAIEEPVHKMLLAACRHPL